MTRLVRLDSVAKSLTAGAITWVSILGARVVPSEHMRFFGV